MNFFSYAGGVMVDGSAFQEQLKAAVYEARQRTFYLVEPLLGSHQNWHFIRSQLLKIFGRDGLERFINGSDFTTGTENCGNHSDK